jgi:hypothetical protein
MRVIKLSEAEFSNLEEVREFFAGLAGHEPPGKFRVPKGWIAKDALDVNEQLVFTFQGTAVFTANALAGIQANTGAYKPDYPAFFQIDRSTVREANDCPAGRELLGKLARGQGWNRLADSNETQALWVALR